MTLFEIKAPDGRLLRQEHESLDVLRKNIVPGYEVIGVVYGAADDGSGGMVERIGGPSLLKTMLDAHGDELIDWLKARK